MTAELPPGALRAAQLYPGPRSPEAEQVEAVADLVRIIADTTAERDRYRAALDELATLGDEVGDSVRDGRDIARRALHLDEDRDDTGTGEAD